MPAEIILMVLTLTFSVLAVFSRRLIYSAVALGLSSCLLAIIFFDLEAPFAASFELSVGAGLISLLFIMAISLSSKREETKDE
jgi:NADH-quinone oxidoreductase subunit J